MLENLSSKMVKLPLDTIPSTSQLESSSISPQSKPRKNPNPSSSTISPIAFKSTKVSDNSMPPVSSLSRFNAISTRSVGRSHKRRYPPLTTVPKSRGTVLKSPLKDEKQDWLPRLGDETSSRSRSVAREIGSYSEEATESEQSDTEETIDVGNLKVTMLKPIYPCSCPTVLFEYPPQCLQTPRSNERCYTLSTEETRRTRLYYKIKGCHTYNCIVNTLSFNGFTLTTTKKFNILFGNVPKPSKLRKLNKYQKTNHHPGAWNLGRKDNLWKNVWRMRRTHGSAYEICPQTFLLPDDMNRFKQEQESDNRLLWIMKPAASSCGRGIKVISSKTKIGKKGGYIISRYIANPHLINGRKYDLRIYVCVSSFDPLKIYVYKQGLVRFATQDYSTKKKNLKKRYVHLTNYSVNKRALNFIKNTDPTQSSMGSKWALPALIEYFKEVGINWDAIYERIKDVIIKACIAVEPHIVNQIAASGKTRGQSFETYGFDILLDSDLRPWLLEVNVSPSLSSSSPLDKKIKTSLMCDVFTLSGLVPYDRKKFEKHQEAAKQKRLLGLRGSRVFHKNIQFLKNTPLSEIDLGDDELMILAETEEEFYRKGNFERVFPEAAIIDKYSRFFEVERFNNILVWKWMQENPYLLDEIYGISKKPPCI